MRIASEPALRAWLPLWSLWSLWRAVAAGVAVLSLVTAMVVGRSQQTARARRDVVLPASSSLASGFSQTIDSPPRAVVAARVTSEQETNRRPRQRRPAEVLVAASEVRGLRQLAALVRGGRTEFIFPDERVSDAEAEPVRDIVIAPVAVAPIEIATTANVGMTAEGDEQ
jgi:hypothetical protein